jgi:hypothetical protein
VSIALVANIISAFHVQMKSILSGNSNFILEIKKATVYLKAKLKLS